MKTFRQHLNTKLKDEDEHFHEDNNSLSVILKFSFKEKDIPSFRPLNPQ